MIVQAWLRVSMIVDMTGDEQIGELSEFERLHVLRIFDEVIPRIPARSLRSVERELSALRRARRIGRSAREHACRVHTRVNAWIL